MERRFVSGERIQVDSPAPLDFQEVLTGVPLQAAVRAVAPSVCLSLTFDEMRSVMAESPGLVEGLLRMLCLHAAPEIANPVVRGAGRAVAAGRRLEPVDKAVLLETYPVLSAISREELLGIAATATVLTPAAGAELFAEMDAPALHAVVSGAIAVEPGDGEPPATAASGDAVGLYQMLAGIPLVRRARCAEASVVMRIDREDFVDLLMHRPELLSQLLRTLFTGADAADKKARQASARAAGA